MQKGHATVMPWYAPGSTAGKLSLVDVLQSTVPLMGLLQQSS